MAKNDSRITVAHIMGKWVGGGVESVVMNYYKNIDRSKIRFDFLCDEDSVNIPYGEIEALGGRVITVAPYQKVFTYSKELSRILKENGYKIVHSHINTLSVFPLRVAKKCGIPVRIAHSHSTTNKKEWKKNILKQLLRPFARLYATDLFCCGELAGRWLFGNKAYDEGKVFLLSNAIDTEKFKYDAAKRLAKRQELEIDDDTIAFGHIGRFVTQKNHSFLIDVFDKIYKLNNNTVLLLAGGGPLENDIREKVHSLGLSEHVSFLGQRDDADGLYQAFDAFLLPSLYEGLPVVGIEAQASSLGCLFSDKMTSDVKILDSTVFMSPDMPPESWATAALELSRNTARCDTAEVLAKHGFCIKNEAHKLEEKYMSLWR